MSSHIATRRRSPGALVISSSLAFITLIAAAGIERPVHATSYRVPAGLVPATGRVPTDPVGWIAPPPPYYYRYSPAGIMSRGGTTPPTLPRPVGMPPGAGTPRKARGTPPGLPGRGGRGRRSVEGFERWEFWWEYNKDEFLGERARLERTIGSGSADFFLGFESRDSASSTERPSPRVVATEVVPALIEATRDDDHRIRDAAVLALGKVGDPSALPILIAMLKDPHRAVQESAALALGLLGQEEARPVLVALMNDDARAQKLTGRREVFTRMRALAAAGLGFLGDEAAVPALLEAISSRSEASGEVPVAAIVALGLLKSSDAVDPLIAWVRDDRRNELERAHAASSLGRIGDRRAIPVLARCLRDRSIHVSRSAVLALGLFDPEAVRPVIDDLRDVVTKASDRQSRNWALITLGRIGGDAGRSTLLKALAREQASTQAFAALGLALHARSHGDRDAAAGALRRILAEARNDSTRGAIALALGLIEDRASEESLMRLLAGGSDPALQGYAAIALGLMGARAATREVERLAAEAPDAGLGRATAIALGLLGERRAVPLLASVMSTSHSEPVTGAAALALGSIGDRSAIAPLLELMRASSATTGATRAYATAALGILAESTSRPKLSRIARDANYRAQTDTVRVLLDLL